MSYDTLEVLGGEPVELFKFVYGTYSWFLTSGVEPIDKDGDTYDPVAIKSGNISADGEAHANSIDITVNANNVIASLFKTNQPGNVILVSVFRKQRDADEFASVFLGEIATCKFEDVNAVLTCTPVQSVTQRKIAVLKYQPTCNNRLGDSRCQVIMTDFTYSYAVVAVNTYQDESNLQLGGDAATFFSGDHISWLTGGTVEFDSSVFMIGLHFGQNIGVMGTFDGLLVGSIVVVKAGCDKLVTTCRDKFDNLPRHLGFPYTPTSNPAKSWMPAVGLGFPGF